MAALLVGLVEMSRVDVCHMRVKECPGHTALHVDVGVDECIVTCVC